MAKIPKCATFGLKMLTSLFLCSSAAGDLMTRIGASSKHAHNSNGWFISKYHTILVAVGDS